MLTDSHCHLASHRFPADEVGALVGRARDAGVRRIVTLATGLGDLDANLAVAAAHEGVHACLGIHPCDVHKAPDDAPEQVAARLANPLVCGVGETGLDYFHPAPEGWETGHFRARQREFLDAHFAIAEAAGLNLVIHTRDREGDLSLQEAIEIYRPHADKVRAVFHCFVNNFKNAARILDLGGLVSFGGVATFKNAADVLELTTRLPEGSFMLETDAPYLAPHPHRGQRNEPAFTKVIAQRIAEVRDDSLDSLAEHTSRTASLFFRFRDN